MKNKMGEVFRSIYENAENNIYSPQDIHKIIKTFLKNEMLVKSSKKVYYLNCPCSFDIETTSTTVQGMDIGFMYVWQMCLNGAVIIGRTWEEFEYVTECISKDLNLDINHRILIYIHNINFEFQFIRNRFHWLEVFATDKRMPLKAVTDMGIEFRCSYRLSGYTLETTANNLMKYKVRKKVGDLNYDLIRHKTTPLTKEEIGYCACDVITVCCYIMEEMERNGSISRIPLTATGYARNLCRDYCFGNTLKKKTEYLNFMKEMTLTVDEYKLLKSAYQGGFTHANIEHVGLIQENVSSLDFTSSYPACLVAFRYPMSKGKKYSIKTTEEFLDIVNDKTKVSVFTIAFKNIRINKNAPDAPISASKCSKLHTDTSKLDNGRVRNAEYLETTITNVDYEIYTKYYSWDSFEIKNLYVYTAGYLPSQIIRAISYLYQAKTTLKGVKGSEEEYQHAKALLNSIYGMMCTAVVRDEVVLAEDWTTTLQQKIQDIPDDALPDVLKELSDEMYEKQIDAYNRNKKRFLHYSWGVFCTAYARRNLLLSMLNISSHDHNYSDTDSMKIFNYKNHTDYINRYNDWITKMIAKASFIHGLPANAFCPKTITGVEKPMGVWDYEGTYALFKTLGAKRYMYLEDDVLSFTVAGINKINLPKYMLEKHNIPYYVEKGECHIVDLEKHFDDVIAVFIDFDDNLTIPAELSGKLVAKYGDNPINGEITDYLGNRGKYDEKSYVYLGKSEYNLQINQDYKAIWEMFEQ